MAEKETPLMSQYLQIKAKYPGAILLFRVGDFYETFGEDAVKASKILGIVLTKRANGAASHVELAGFPHHSLDSYLPRLVRAGQRVAICDQLEDPKLTKKIVKRGVTEVISPGVAYNDKILDHQENNFLCALLEQKGSWGISLLDISTGEFWVTEGNLEYAQRILQAFRPAEVLLSKPQHKLFQEYFGEQYYQFCLDDWVFTADFTREKLLTHFETVNLKGFGVEDLSLALIAAGASLYYVSENQHQHLKHISSLKRLQQEEFVWLDRFTIRNLELVQTAHEQGRSLVSVIDQTRTPMGARLLRKWVLMPLKDKIRIEQRLETVEIFVREETLHQQLVEMLQQLGDLERLISRVALRKAGPRELVVLARALEMIPALIQLLKGPGLSRLTLLSDQLHPCAALVAQIRDILQEEAPAIAGKPGVIKDGVDPELDELRKIAHHGKDYLLQLQQKEQERTGISSLKLGFNNVFGYYLEVTHAHKQKVPQEWIRKQTLVNAERYITPDLKEYEEKILGAEEKILAIETRLFLQLLENAAAYVLQVQQNATVIAVIDCLSGFAEVSRKYGYVKPTLYETPQLDFKDLRHPVIEQQLPPGEAYIPNDIRLNKPEQQIIIITGPNMSGKSAVLRQTALAVIMAQMGCFVAATDAHIGVIDRVFTRVGASDNLSMGESTFMVEMTETASILNNLSASSLVILDEIGRGTSTYDGISLAWAITEHLQQCSQQPLTLFATHYHELNELEGQLSGIRNFHVEVKEAGNKVIFLRKLKEGGTEHSFGIHVARMAGIPRSVIDRAEGILHSLESQRSNPAAEAEGIKSKPRTKIQVPTYQLSMFQMDDPRLAKIKEALDDLRPDSLTPMEALLKIQEWKRELQ